MDDDYEALMAIDKLHDVARYIELNYEDSGLHVLIRYCADELMDLRDYKKQAAFTTADLLNKINNLSKIKKP